MLMEMELKEKYMQTNISSKCVWAEDAFVCSKHDMNFEVEGRERERKHAYSTQVCYIRVWITHSNEWTSEYNVRHDLRSFFFAHFFTAMNQSKIYSHRLYFFCFFILPKCESLIRFPKILPKRLLRKYLCTFKNAIESLMCNKCTEILLYLFSMQLKQLLSLNSIESIWI